MYILLDIGGTNTRIAGSQDGKTFGDPIQFATPKSFEEGMGFIIEHARSLAGGAGIRAIAGGVKGPVDTNGVLVNPPGLPDWRGKNIKQKLEESLETLVCVENDTALVGLGEAVAGAGKQKDIVAYITVSTGTNGVRIVRGALDYNRFGFEIGHHIIYANEKVLCTCGNERTLGHPEAYITGAAFERRFGKKAYEVTDENVWDEAAQILAVLLHNTIAFWSPDVIVVGGSMVTGEKGPVISLGKARTFVERLRTIAPMMPPIIPAELGSFGGVYGALALIASRID